MIPLRFEVTRPCAIFCISFSYSCFEAVELLELATFDVKRHGGSVDVSDDDSSFGTMDREQ